MDSEAGTPLLDHKSWNLRGTFAASLAGLTTILLAVLAALGRYAPHLTDAHVDRYYSFLTDVSFQPGEWLGCCTHSWLLCTTLSLNLAHTLRPAHPHAPPPRCSAVHTWHLRRLLHAACWFFLIPNCWFSSCCVSHLQVYVMIFLGFGFLMTFLKRYSYSAVALNFVGSALVILESVLAIGWAQQGFGAVEIDLPLLIDCAFAAGASRSAGWGGAGGGDACCTGGSLLHGRRRTNCAFRVALLPAGPCLPRLLLPRLRHAHPGCPFTGPTRAPCCFSCPPPQVRP